MAYVVSMLGSSPGQVTVFLGKTLYSHSTSLHPGYMHTWYDCQNAGGLPGMD